jgi:hypothetical protein
MLARCEGDLGPLTMAAAAALLQLCRIEGRDGALRRAQLPTGHVGRATGRRAEPLPLGLAVPQGWPGRLSRG